MKKVFDKCKVIHALKQPENLLHLLSEPKVQNCVSKKFSLYRYEFKDSCCNLCASYIQEYSIFITSNGYYWKQLRVTTDHPLRNLTTMFLKVLIKTIMLTRNLILKFLPLWQSIMKINCCYESYLHKMKFDTMNCQLFYC